MNIFLRIRHWQLFVVLFGIPFILQMIGMFFVISTNNPKVLFVTLPLLTLLLIGVFLGWLYALGTNLYKKLPETVTMSLTRFRIFLFYPMAYMFLICIAMFGVIKYAVAGGQPNPAIFLIIFPLHIFAMYCMFYCLYFVSKSLKSVELQRAVTFSDYAGEFFLIWFFPVGVWLIQPRINQMFGYGSASSSV